MTFIFICVAIIVFCLGKLLSGERPLMDSMSYEEITEMRRKIMESKID